MALTEKHYAHQVEALLPRGPIWHRRQGGMLDAILYALAREAARVDERANAVLEEADPRSSIEELERWFDEWGIPSECLAAIADPSREQMRQELLAKITSNLGCIFRVARRHSRLSGKSDDIHGAHSRQHS